MTISSRKFTKSPTELRSAWMALGLSLLILAGCQSASAPRPGTTTGMSSSNPTGTASGAPAASLFPLLGAATVNVLKVPAVQGWQSEEMAGSGSADFADGLGDQASLAYPWDLAVNVGADVFVADRFNHRIRKLVAKQLSTLAGQNEPGLTDGQGSQSRFNNPQGLAIGPNGEIYVADTGAGAIRRVSPTGEVSTLLKDLKTPGDVVAMANGNLIVADSGSHRLLFWSAASRQMQVLSGQTEGLKNGPAAQAQFFTPRGLALGTDGNLYISDSLNHVIRKLSRDGVVSTLAGNGKQDYTDGSATEASFNEPGPLALDGEGNLLVVDVGNAKIRRVTPTGEVTTLQLPEAIQKPQGLAINQDYLWLSDARKHAIFRLKPVSP